MAKRPDMPTPADLADMLTATATAMTHAAVDATERGDQRGLRALQAVEPAVRRAAEALVTHGQGVTEALERMGRGTESPARTQAKVEARQGERD